jgi:anti-sigma B factor antagonist
MAFEISQREQDGTVILAPHGRLVLGAPLETFRSALERLVAAGQIRVVLDLRHTDYVDSSALGCLVVAHTRIEKAGGAMAMYGLNRRNVELLVITKLATVFRLAENEADAVTLCYPGREVSTFDILSFVEHQRESGREK